MTRRSTASSPPPKDTPQVPLLSSGAPDLALEDLFLYLYRSRYTGGLHLDFRNGQPLFYAVGKPHRGKLLTRSPSSHDTGRGKSG